jgi:hypothetical protein
LSPWKSIGAWIGSKRLSQEEMLKGAFQPSCTLKITNVQKTLSCIKEGIQMRKTLSCIKEGIRMCKTLSCIKEGIQMCKTLSCITEVLRIFQVTYYLPQSIANTTHSITIGYESNNAP